MTSAYHITSHHNNTIFKSLLSVVNRTRHFRNYRFNDICIASDVSINDVINFLTSLFSFIPSLSLP